jgi:bifunctional DNA-binding transcriptional regulator/antitoxin component of YhaV-PrlF toxin-antitoxin module
MTQEPEVTTASEKGQVVIPQALREEMWIKPICNPNPKQPIK